MQSHVTYINESRHVWISHVTFEWVAWRLNESRPVYVRRTTAIETGIQSSALAVVLATRHFPDPILTALPGMTWVMSHIHNESFDERNYATHFKSHMKWVMSHIWNEACHTYEVTRVKWIMSHMWTEACLTYEVTHMKSHIWSHTYEVTHMKGIMSHISNEACHTDQVTH